jgi:hypothetical protein
MEAHLARDGERESTAAATQHAGDKRQKPTAKHTRGKETVLAIAQIDAESTRTTIPESQMNGDSGRDNPERLRMAASPGLPSGLALSIIGPLVVLTIDW